MALNFLKNLLQTDSRKRTARRSREMLSYRPWLEPLEERLLLAFRIWDGGGADNNWMTAANWDAAVVAGDSLLFPAVGVDATSRTNTNNFPIDTAFASIELRGNTSYTIGGTRIALGNGGLLVNAPAGAHNWNSDLLLNGLGVPFLITSGATLTVNGVLSGNAPLNKGSDGTLVLTADNNGTLPFSGFVNVNAGVVQISHPEALGNTTGETNVVDFATLRLEAGADGGSEVIRLGGTLVAAATLAWNGLVEILGTEIRVDTGATLTLDELIGDPILKTGPGTLAVSDGNFGGGTVAEGFLRLQGNVDVGNLMVNTGAAVEVQGNVTINAGTLTIQGGGQLAHGALLNVSGNNTWTGPISLSGPSFIGSDLGSLTVSGNIANNGFVLKVNGEGTTIFGGTGILSGTGVLDKIGSGTLRLEGTGVNSYSGATLVTFGILNIRKPSALGPAAGNGTAVSPGGALQVQGGITFNSEPLTLSVGIGGIGEFRSISGNNIWPGNITLASASTIGCDANMLTVNGNIANAGFLLTVNGAGTTVFGGTGVLGGGGGLTKAGTGTLRLEGTGVNTYTGTTNVNAGILNIRKASALGSSAGVGTVVASGAALQVQGGITFAAELLTLNGSGIGGTGALRNISGNNIWPNQITLASASTIGSDTNTLSVTGNISNTGFLLTVTGAGNTTFGGAGVVGGGGGLTKTGTGTLTLEGTAANTYTGPTSVNGTLRLNKQTAGTTAVPGLLAINGLNATLPAVVTLLNDNQIANGSAISIGAFGTLALNSQNETIGALAIVGGDVTTGTGLLTLGGNVTASSSSSAGPAEISGNLSLGGVNRIFTINDGTNSVDMLVSAVIRSGTSMSPGFPAGLAKAGPGTLQFTGNNTYNRTEINAGRLIIDGNQAGGIALNKGTIVNTGAILQGVGTVQPLTVNSGGSVRPGSTGIGVLTSQGNLVLNSGSNFVGQVVPIVNVPSDRLAVVGTVNISGATLQVQPAFLPTTTPGATFRIIDNDGTDAVAGTFLNRPENTTFSVQVQGVLNGQVVVQTQTYRINYGSGDGNDVVLTYLNSATMARDLAVTPDVINEGERVTLTGRLVDPDHRGPLTLQVDWGDGSPVQIRQQGAAPFRLQHRYPSGQPSGGQYRINVRWFDQHGAGNNQDLFVTVNSIAASFEFAGAQTTNLRAEFGRNGSFANRTSDSSTAPVDDGDGAGVQPLDRPQIRRFQLSQSDSTWEAYAEIVTLCDDGGGANAHRFSAAHVANSLSRLERLRIGAWRCGLDYDVSCI